MAQKLIVEGNDAIVLAQLCKARGLQPPLGYETIEKFREEFVSSAKGYNNISKVLNLALQQADLNNIGVIVDANQVGATARWLDMREVLVKYYSEDTLVAADVQTGAKIITEDNLPTIGIWIMPNNADVGYLETFLAQLTPHGDALWEHATRQVQQLLTLSFCELKLVKVDKANLHTWLAWKPEPGKPFGQAVDAGYFQTNAPAVQPFLDWFAATFKLADAHSGQNNI